jgi:hypothetical protein
MRQLEIERKGAYWDVYDIKTGKLIATEYFVTGKSWPAIGEIVVGIPGRPQTFVKDVKLKGMKGKLPHYDIYV